MAAYGPDPGAPTGLWRLVRGGLRLALAWTVVAVGVSLAIVVALLTLRIRSEAWFHLVARGIGRTVLRLGGIRLRVVNGERLAGRRTRILAINHSSQLDMLVFGAIMPPYGTALVKREFLFVPFFGWAFVVFKLLVVDRGDREKAKRSVARAARRLREQRATVFIAPEGTRSRDGTLGPFKMGLFHLAAEVHVPIVPAIIRGAAECQPLGTYIPSPGTVEIELLPEVPTDDYREDNLHEKRDELRALFLRELGASDSLGERA